jgi:hypothetical protein
LALILTLSANSLVAGPLRDVTVPAGTVLRVQLESTLASDFSRPEDAVRGCLVSAIVIDGKPVVPIGSRVTGFVTQAERSGQVKGRARLGVRFDSLVSEGVHYRIATRPWMRVAPASKSKDAATIGIPATGGAIVGGLVGGKKGAGIGALAGGGGGTAAVMATRGKEVRLGRGAVVHVRLDRPLTVRIG